MFRILIYGRTGLLRESGEHLAKFPGRRLATAAGAAIDASCAS